MNSDQTWRRRGLERRGRRGWSEGLERREKTRQTSKRSKVTPSLFLSSLIESSGCSNVYFVLLRVLVLFQFWSNLLHTWSGPSFSLYFYRFFLSSESEITFLRLPPFFLISPWAVNRAVSRTWWKPVGVCFSVNRGDKTRSHWRTAQSPD